MAVVYDEEDLTEATKILAYLRSIRVYAAALALLSLVYLGIRIFSGARGTELSLLFLATGILILGSLSVIFRISYKTALLFGAGSLMAGGAFAISALAYQGGLGHTATAIALLAGLIIVWRGYAIAFGSRSQYAFAGKNRGKVAFVTGILQALKQSGPDDPGVIHCTYTNDGKKKNLRIKFLDAVVCFLFEGQSEPVFFDRSTVYIFELQMHGDVMHVSVTAHSHDWIEADFTKADFKKYQEWKGL